MEKPQGKPAHSLDEWLSLADALLDELEPLFASTRVEEVAGGIGQLAIDVEPFEPVAA